MKKQSVAGGVFLSVMLFCHAGQGQVTLSGTNYVQNFNSDGAGLPAGWSVRTNASATSPGTPAVFITATTNWGASSGQFANFASTINNDGSLFAGSETPSVQTAATNRCLGMRQTSTYGDPGAAFVLQLHDTAGRSNFRLNFDFNMLNLQGRSTVWTVDYGLGENPASFVAVGTCTDPGSYGSTPKTFTFGGALDNQNQTVWIRVVALAVSTGTGSRDAMGIDNVLLSYDTAVAAPVPLSIRSSGSNVVLSWENPAFGLQAAPSPSGLFTNVPGAMSPYTNAASGSQRFFRLVAN
jgi:hypothetical protein